MTSLLPSNSSLHPANPSLSREILNASPQIPPPDEKPQIERFREAARELGCDDSEATFWEKVVKVARHKPRDEPKKTPKE
jgi:hypothetical protein